MPKKTPSKEPAKPEEIPAEQESANPPPKPNKSRIEIDEIFSAKKRKKSDQDKEPSAGKSDETDVNAEGKPAKAKKRKRIKKDDGFVNSRPSSSKPRKKTQDGLTLYTEEELGIGKSDAGGTPLCPFDCSCCF